MAYNIDFFQLIKNASMTGAITSAAVETKQQDNIGIQFNWTGTPTGTFSVMVSLDHKQDAQGNVTVPGNWIPLTLSPAITATGSANTAYVDLNQLSAAYIQVVYTPTSGTGTLNVFIGGKGV